MAYKYGRGDSYSGMDYPDPKVPGGWSPGGGDNWYVQTTTRSDSEWEMECDDKGLHEVWVWDAEGMTEDESKEPDEAQERNTGG